MDREKYSFKDVFRLRIRICLLIVLVVFILGFIFIPEWEIEIETVEPIEPPITIIPASPDEVVNIAVVPKVDVGKVIDEEFKEKDVDPIKVKNPNDNSKEARVEFGDNVIFYAYEVPPIPLNLDDVKFEYPGQLIPLGIEGIVYLELLIDKEGNVRNVRLFESLHPFLDKIAVEKAWELKFSPAMQREKAVAVYYSFPVEFKLE